MIGIAIVHDKTYGQSWITARRTCDRDSRLVCIGMHKSDVSMHHVACLSMEQANDVMSHITELLADRHLYDDWYSLSGVETGILIGKAEVYRDSLGRPTKMSKSANDIDE